MELVARVWLYAVYAVYAISSPDTSSPLRYRTQQPRRDTWVADFPRQDGALTPGAPDKLWRPERTGTSRKGGINNNNNNNNAGDAWSCLGVCV